MLPMEPIADVQFMLGDFREQKVLELLESRLLGRKVDVVLSDMAPNLSGIPSADAARMEDIIELAIEFSKAHLKLSGCLLVKCFHGPAYNSVWHRFKSEFNTVSSKKPKASRDKSSEIFILGRGLKLS
jgi:23S rRNA (uridine2552-2'-O)-methyltransferase